MRDRICLSFLGVGDYSKTTYAFRTENVRTRFIAHALTRFFPGRRHIVLLTEAGEAKHGEDLRTACSFEAVRVPEGRTEEELWELFSVVAEQVPEGAELVVDVTHGLRQLPVLMLAACQYLMATKRVTVEHILYGAFMLKDDDSGEEGGITPVLDLQPFLELMQWANNTDQLWGYGNAGPLADQLQNLQARSHREGWDYRARGLSSLGTEFAKFNRALSLVRPTEVLAAALRVPRALERARDDARALPQARPLNLLFGRMEEKASSFAVPGNDLFSPEGFAAQAKMIEHYLQTEQYQQAITLAREALVSWRCAVSGGNASNRNDRKATEEALNALVKRPQREDFAEPEHNEDSRDLTEPNLIDLWDQLSDLRNDINHAGMRPQPQPVDTAISNIEQSCKIVIDHLQNVDLPK